RNWLDLGRESAQAQRRCEDQAGQGAGGNICRRNLRRRLETPLLVLGIWHVRDLDMLKPSTNCHIPNLRASILLPDRPLPLQFPQPPCASEAVPGQSHSLSRWAHAWWAWPFISTSSGWYITGATWCRWYLASFSSA